MAQDKELIGTQVIYTNSDDQSFDGFVAAMDIDLGITIKPLDIDRVRKEYIDSNTPDEDMNLICLNKARIVGGHHLIPPENYVEAYNHYKDAIMLGRVKEGSADHLKIERGTSIARLSSCAFK